VYAGAPRRKKMQRGVLCCIFFACVLCELKRGKWFDRIVIIQFENHSENEVVRDPNFKKYANMGRALLSYFAITQPSQPNYWCQVAGDYFKLNSDDNHDLPQSNLFDLMEHSGVSWKMYQEAYPGHCNAEEVVGTYWRKHNPAISFNSVRNNSTRCAKIVSDKEFDIDLDANELPNYSYFTPDINNDGHDTSVAYAGKWLDGFLTPRLHKFENSTIIVISWDEDDFTELNHILVSMLDPHGTVFKPGSKDSTKYNHYSLLATVEQNWDLGNLGRNDKNADVFNFR